MDGTIATVRCMKDQNLWLAAKIAARYAQYQRIFQTLKEDLDRNEFDDKFLREYHARLVHYLMEVFCLSKSTIECFS